MLCSIAGRKVEYHVLETSRLRGRPMYASRDLVRWDLSGIEDEVPDLTEEGICRSEARFTGGLVRRTVDQAETSGRVEGGCSANGREAIGVTNDLSD